MKNLEKLSNKLSNIIRYATGSAFYPSTLIIKDYGNSTELNYFGYNISNLEKETANAIKEIETISQTKQGEHLKIFLFKLQDLFSQLITKYKNWYDKNEKKIENLENKLRELKINDKTYLHYGLIKRCIYFIEKEINIIEKLYNPAPETASTMPEPAPTPEPVNEIGNKIMKLQWNGNKNQLYWLFRELKNLANKKKQPIISNSYDEIATFIVQHFTGFENANLPTITKELKSNKKPKKAINIDGIGNIE